MPKDLETFIYLEKGVSFYPKFVAITLTADKFVYRNQRVRRVFFLNEIAC